MANKDGQIIVDGMKRCSVCQLMLPVALFHRSNSTPTGLESRCKACARLAQVGHLAMHPIPIEVSRKRRARLDPEKVRAHQHRTMLKSDTGSRRSGLLKRSLHKAACARLAAVLRLKRSEGGFGCSPLIMTTRQVKSGACCARYAISASGCSGMIWTHRSRGALSGVLREVFDQQPF